MLGRLWVVGCTLWPGRRGVRASVAQQPVSATAGAASAGETVRYVVRRWGGCAAWHGYGGDCRAKRCADVGRMVWLSLAHGVGSAMAGRRACCWLLFLPQVLVGLRHLSPHTVVIVRRGEVYTADAAPPSFCSPLTVVGCTRRGYRWTYGARWAALVATHYERVCHGLLLVGMPQVRPHTRRDGPMCCPMVRRLLPP